MYNCACVGQAYTATTTVKMIAAIMSATNITASIHVGLAVDFGSALIVSTFDHRGGSNNRASLTNSTYKDLRMAPCEGACRLLVLS